MPSDKIRLDLALVERGLLESREKAQGAILAGWVLVNGEPARKPSQLVSADSIIEIKQKQKFVSRGGEKLESALSHFNIDVAGKIAADLGASTGGFTDCLLQHGAKKVYSIDVGYGQLAYQLRQDPRVAVCEKQNARNLTYQAFPDPIEFLTADLSFISLVKVLPAIQNILIPGGQAVLLVKPQFEAEKEEVEKGGVIRDPAVHERVVRQVSSAAKKLGLIPMGDIPSPLLGPAGNREFLLWLEKPLT